MADTRDGRRPPAVDLDRLTVPELTALRDAAEAKRLEKLEEAKNAVLAETRAKLAELGLTLEAALPPPGNGAGAGAGTGAGRKRRRDAGQPLLVRYRGPRGDTWSGRGRVPRWLQALEAEGRRREEFRTPQDEA